MSLTVLHFAAARERAGTGQETVDWRGGTVRQLLEELVARHPGLRSLVPHLRVAVNQEFLALDAQVPDGAEVALVPPVAGGSGCFRLSEAPLSLDEVVQAVGGPERGGLVTFTGTVRTETRGRRVRSLSYEAYPAMAERAMAAIGQEIETRWAGSRAAIVHRVGHARAGRGRGGHRGLLAAPRRGVRGLPARHRAAQGRRAHLEEGALRGRRGVGGARAVDARATSDQGPIERSGAAGPDRPTHASSEQHLTRRSCARPPGQLIRGVLSPFERASEVMFGLIMALTITGALSVANATEHETRALFVSSLACNLAWGLVDGVLYVFNALVERGRRMLVSSALREGADGVDGPICSPRCSRAAWWTG